MVKSRKHAFLKAFPTLISIYDHMQGNEIYFFLSMQVDRKLSPEVQLRQFNYKAGVSHCEGN